MKKIKSIVLIGLIGLSLVGCVKPENNNEGLKLTENSENDVIDKSTESTENNENEVIDESSESTDTAADGFYYAGLYSNGKDEIGVEDEWGNLPAIAYNTRIDGDKLIISGSMYYSDTNDFEDSETSDDIEHVFVFDENTEFYWVTGPEEREEYEADSFIKDLESFKDTGLGLCVEVEDGVAKEVSVSP